MYKTLSSGLLGSNTYIVWDERSREAMIIDCGNYPRTVLGEVEARALKVKYIVLTHAHYDHAEFVLEYKRTFVCSELIAHECEVAVMNDPEANVTALFGAPKTYGYPDKTVREGDEICLGNSKYRVLHTPGHTPGCICLYNEEERLMFTGDTLFECSRGRTDFKFGCEEDMRASLCRLFRMAPEITFLSGHGGPSTIGREAERVY